MDGLSGSVKTMPLRDLVLYIGSRQLSGTLQCENGSLRKSVVVQDGSAVMASSSHPQEYFSELLVIKGFIDQQQLQQAVQHGGGGAALGRSLVSIGVLDEARVREALQLKIRDTVVSLMDWTSGSFQFVEDDSQLKSEKVDALVDLLQLYHENNDNAEGDGSNQWLQLRQVLESQADITQPRALIEKNGESNTTDPDYAVDGEFAEMFRRDVENRLAERGRGKRFPKDLQRRAVQYYRARTHQGSFLSEVARELGLPPPTLRRWVLDAPPDAGVDQRGLGAMALQTARLSLTQTAGAPVLVGPNGLRIEGLDVVSLAELLRRLEG